MLVIRFGKWNHKATSMFIYTRIFRSGYKWTPFCIKKFRYVGQSVMADTEPIRGLRAKTLPIDDYCEVPPDLITKLTK